jgi:phage terminase large subunit
MLYKATTATHKLLKLTKRIKAVAGGTSASKTISILLVLIDKSQSDKTPKITSVTAESVPHLKRGAMRDFLSIMQEHGYWKQSNWNATDFIYTFETGSKIEFFSTDNPDKSRGPRRDRLYMNEANNQTYSSFEQMEVRTRDEVWLDWNPSSEFWFYTEVLPNRKDDIDFITLTYLDNEALDASIVQSIESRRNNKSWWQVYGLGQLGETEGRVFTGWNFIDEVPHEARLERRGLDFGYSNDPSTIIDLYYYNGGYILDEQLYQKGLSNKQLADFIGNLPDSNVLVKADSAEPKSIDEIKSYGVNILPVVKGKDSVVNGIQLVQDKQISVTKRSTNLIKEYRNYMWETDKEGRILNVPVDMWNHCMDAIRYAFEGMKPNIKAAAVFNGGDKITGFGGGYRKLTTARTFR